MLVRAQFPDIHLATMLPALDALIFKKYRQYPTQFNRYFRVMSSTRDIEQTTQLSGLGLPVSIAEGGAMIYDNPVQGFDKTYTHTQAGLGFRISKMMAMNNKHGIISKMAGELGRSVKEYIDITVANHFNNGFSGSYLGPDGVSLFSASHPLVKQGGVQSNTLATPADVGHASVQLVLTAFRKQLDAAGKKIRIEPKKLVVAPEGEFAAAEALGMSRFKPGTANNDVNALNKRSGFSAFDSFEVWDYLTDADNWFVVADPGDTELRYYWREKPSTVHEIDFDTRTIKTAIWFQNSHGWSDYLGVFGVQGA